MDPTPPPSPSDSPEPEPALEHQADPSAEPESSDAPGSELTAEDLDAQVVARLGHDRDPLTLRRKLVDAEAVFEAGDSRLAAQRFRELLGASTSPELRAEAKKGLRYVEPDRRTLLLGAVFFVLLVVVWVAALRASH